MGTFECCDTDMSLVGTAGRTNDRGLHVTLHRCLLCDGYRFTHHYPETPGFPGWMPAVQRHLGRLEQELVIANRLQDKNLIDGEALEADIAWEKRLRDEHEQRTDNNWPNTTN